MIDLERYRIDWDVPGIERAPDGIYVLREDAEAQYADMVRRCQEWRRRALDFEYRAIRAEGKRDELLGWFK